MSDRGSFQFTLRDLVVAMAAIAVLLALIPVGLHLTSGPSGDSGRRITCLNNQKNIALATIGFAEARGFYPGYANTVGGRTVSYVVPILPNVEHSDIYSILDDPSQSPDRVAVFLAVFVCPQSPQAKGGGPNLTYVLNGGQADLSRDLDPDVTATRTKAAGIGTDLTVPDPIRVSPAYVLNHDGTSHTFLLGENLQAESWMLNGRDDLKRWNTFMWWSDPFPAGPADYRINVGRDTAPKPTFDRRHSRPSSNHSGGCVFSFCDGSTRFISEDIDYQVYKQLMTPYGAESEDRDNRPLVDGDY